MKQSVLIILFFYMSGYLKAQNNDADFWYFGQNAGIKFINNKPIVQVNGAINTWEGTGSIKVNDSSYFYSDGTSIFNKNNNKINNILLYGNKSATQGVLFYKNIANDSNIFLFTTTLLDFLECPLYFYKLKIINDTNLSIIDTKLINRFGSEKINMVNHKNEKDKWLITHSYYNNYYLTYLLKNNGLILCNNSLQIGSNYKNYIYPNAGQIKFNKTGTKVAASTVALHYVDLFKFDNEKGIIFDSISLYVVRNYGIEFSKDERFLYVSDLQGNLRQFDLSVWNADSIKASEKIITNKGVKKISALQLAPNGKIYWSNNDSLYLAAIEEPNKKGDSCKLNFRSIYLEGKKSAYGLPTFNQSYFHTPAINYNYEMECINNSVQFWGKDTFGANGFSWQVRKLAVGSWQNASSNKNFTYAFTDTGKYEVRYLADNGIRKDTISKTITIYPKIKKQFLGKDTTYIQGSAINKTLQAPYGMHCQQWQDTSGLSTFTAIKKGIYTCKVTNQAFCEITDTIEIKECLSLAIPSIYKRLTDSIFCTHPLADTFIWYRNNVPYKTTTTNGGDISSLKLTDTGTYRAEAVKYGHCNRTSSTFNINKLGFGRLMTEDLGIKVYPNPSNGIINIQSDKSYKLEVTDITGRKILQTENIKQIVLPKGVYFFRFEIGNSMITEKVIIL